MVAVHAVSSHYASLTLPFGITVSAKFCCSHNLLPWYLNYYKFTLTCTKRPVYLAVPVTSIPCSIISIHRSDPMTDSKRKCKSIRFKPTVPLKSKRKAASVSSSVP